MTKKEMMSAIQILEDENKKLQNENAKLLTTNGYLNIDVASCTARISELKNEKETLQKLVEERDAEIAKIIALRSAVPDDCEQSELCHACIFGVEYFTTVRKLTPLETLTPSTQRFMVCKKDEFKCKNFKQKTTDVETK